MADEKALQDHTVAELDELALVHELEAYPSSGNKAEKIEALEEAGVTGSPLVVYRFQLREDYFDEGVEATGSFMVSEPPKPSRAVNLDAGEVFSTSDRSVAVGLRDVPFLEEVEA